jgi:peptidyl-prolyl cis-trans isomerase A (cyclophilin A)
VTSGAKIGRRTLLGGAGLLLAAPLSYPGAAFAAGGKPRVRMVTNHGVIVVELEAEKAPITSNNFLRYVDARKYDGGSFFRTVPTPGYPNEGTIVGGPAPKTHPYPPIAHEPTTKTGLKHDTGTISIGRFDLGSATDNFFICLNPEPSYDAHPGAKGDNQGFAAFGQVVSGMAVVRKIHGLPANGKSPFPDQKGQWLDPTVPILSMRRV